MNKAQLIDAMAEKSGLTKADTKKALESFIDSVSDALKVGDRVGLVGFGSFAIVKRAERTGRNPKTREVITIPAKNTIKFKAGNELSEGVQ
ncbi:MAG: HU family DNA-binding protein [Salinivirgaceae bacterium]|nr:HU family DNA-binding protein [Salinivirgaceae bacterium]MDY0279092.1 HU family DNA-binding protein [Salinivirgaceae bacterium]